MKVVLATGLFAVVHSAFASRTAKDFAARTFPSASERYRVVYIGQALASFGALAWYIARRPRKTLYEIKGPAAVLMRMGQAGGVLFAIAAARATGIATLAGFDIRRDDTAARSVRFAPAAQGPEVDRSGRLRTGGPFRIVRHPLNLAPLPPFWLTPHMTSRRLAFNCVATIYLVVGSYHEEVRLRAAYGEAYEQYRRSGVPFYVPSLPRLLR